MYTQSKNHVCDGVNCFTGSLNLQTNIIAAKEKTSRHGLFMMIVMNTERHCLKAVVYYVSLLCANTMSIG